MYQPANDKIGFLRWKKKTYTETSNQVGYDGDILSGQSVQRTFSLDAAISIHVSKAGSDANTGYTEALAKLTLDGALAAITATRHQIVICDSETYECPKSIAGTAYFGDAAATSRYRFGYLTGIYAKQGYSPTITDTSPKCKELADYATTSNIRLAYQNNIFCYKNNIYYLGDDGGGGKLKIHDVYTNLLTTYATNDWNSTKNKYNLIKKDNLLYCSNWTDEEIAIYDMDTNTDSASVAFQNIGNYDQWFLSLYTGYQNYVWVFGYDNGGGLGSSEIQYFDGSNMNVVGGTSTNAYTPANYGVFCDYFVAEDGWHYTIWQKKITAFKCDSTNGITQLSDILTKNWCSFGISVVSNQIKTIQNNFVILVNRDDGVYQLSGGIATKIIDNIIIQSITDTQDGYLYSYTDINNPTLETLQYIKQKNFNLIGAGETIIFNNATVGDTSQFTAFIVSDNKNNYYFVSRQNNGARHSFQKFSLSHLDFINHTNVKPTSDTRLLIHSDNTNANTAFTCWANGTTGRHTVTPVNAATHSTAQHKLGNSSILFTRATDDYLSITTALTDFNYSSGNWWCWEAWVYRTDDNPSTFFHVYVDASNYYELVMNSPTAGKCQLVWRTTSAFKFTTHNTSIPLNQWAHVAVTFNGSACYIYVNGVGINDTSVSGQTLTGVIARVRVGDRGSGDNFQGYMDEIVFSTGSGTSPKYAANFTAPQAPEPWGSIDYDEGCLQIQGIKFDSVYAESNIKVPVVTQKVQPKHSSFYGAAHSAIMAYRFRTVYTKIKNAKYWLFADRDYFIDEIDHVLNLVDANYTDFYGTHLLVINSPGNIYYNQSVLGTEDCTFWGCTFFNVGTFDNIDIITKAFTLYQTILSNPIYNDYGTATAGSVGTLGSNLYDALLKCNSTTISGYNETALFNDITVDDLRIRGYVTGYKIYNSIINQIGAFYQSYTAASGNIELVELPIPQTINYSLEYKQLGGNTTLTGKYVKDIDYPIYRITLEWDASNPFEFKDFLGLKKLMESNDWWEFFKDNNFSLSSYARIERTPVTDYRFFDNTNNVLFEWLGRIVQWYYDASNIYISQVSDEITESDFIDKNFYNMITGGEQLYTNPYNTENTKLLRGYPVFIESENPNANTNFIKDSTGIYRNYSGIKLTLIVDLNHNFEED